MKNVMGTLSRRDGVRGAYSIALCCLFAVSVACEDDDGPTGIDDEVATVELTTTGPINLEVGSTSQLSFEIRDVDGNLIDPDDVDVVFTTNMQTIATVSTGGLVTPLAPGTATITIRVGMISDAITVHVGPEISSIDIVQTDIDLVSGETTTLEVTVLDAAGNPVSDPGLVFTSSEGFVASINANGVVTAIMPGTATITAEGGDESDGVDVTVLAAASGGISLAGNAFTAMIGNALTINDLVTVRDAGGFIIPDAELAFEISDPDVVSVDTAGLLTALTAGDALITVTSPDATGEATFRLSVLEAGSVDVITLDTNPAEAPTIFGVGETVDLDVFGHVIGELFGVTNFLAVFTSSNPAVATVDPFTGVVTGVAVGMATVTATNGPLTTFLVITVQ